MYKFYEATGMDITEFPKFTRHTLLEIIGFSVAAIAFILFILKVASITKT